MGAVGIFVFTKSLVVYFLKSKKVCLIQHHLFLNLYLQKQTMFENVFVKQEKYIIIHTLPKNHEHVSIEPNHPFCLQSL